jgi:hypothetical protein
MKMRMMRTKIFLTHEAGGSLNIGDQKVRHAPHLLKYLG